MEWGRLIYEKVYDWLQIAIKMLPNLAVAVIVLVLFALMARVIKKLAYRLMFRLSDTPAVSGLFSSVTYFIVIFVGLFIALDVLKLEKTVSSLLAGAGIIGLALGFAFQDLTANFISGIFITFRKPFEVGHQIETNGFTGTVDNIQLRSTTLRTIDGLHVIIPNKDIFQKPIINHSLTSERRVSLTFNAPINNAQTTLAKDLIQRSLEGLPNIASYKPCNVLFSNIDGANVKITVNCWVTNEDVEAYELTMNAIIIEVMTVLRENKLV